MRKVIITGTPPADWVAEADAITAQLLAAADDIARQAIVDENEKHWRDQRIRGWLMSQFANKCWYTEAEESVSPIHVDHFRPKGRVKNLDGSYEEGYWWLTFNWKNYVIAGHLINTKKSDFFPLMEGERRAAVNSSEVQLKLEGAVLIDPLTDQTRLISYERDDDGCIAVLAGDIDDLEKFKAEKTIEILGLNRIDRLNQKRGKKWDDCLKDIQDYRGARAHGAHALVWLVKETAIARLKERIKYDAEFSSVAEACIRKQAPEAVIAAVFERRSNM
ncbi:hypothetical protein [Vibrio navarrensis]|uniref:HNH nuclease domain-containing protein n=1 Tax=Vibrio navarrensis TaxID=29495 RepID=A0A099LS91_9VIBR|nr:hypothetical protein [Vibrio navarrensis]KGK10950.1 hypothetical protein EA26_06390 [Vibrio navarrensis]MBE4613822.1 hypothetical protein [Vibrio navarrensis]QOD69114.1 hypothetical protein IF132_09740 [Vibrio navarrensis]